MDEEAVVSQADLVGVEISTRRVLVSHISVSGGRGKGVASHAGVVQMDPPVVERAHQTEGNLHLPYFLSLPTGHFPDGQAFEPCIVEGAPRTEVKMARVG